MTRFINQDADEGLRTLLFATKQIDRQSYEEWNTRYQNYKLDKHLLVKVYTWSYAETGRLD